jgi:hypothetical protein
MQLNSVALFTRSFEAEKVSLKAYTRKNRNKKRVLGPIIRPVDIAILT